MNGEYPTKDFPSVDKIRKNHTRSRTSTNQSLALLYLTPKLPKIISLFTPPPQAHKFACMA